MASKNLPGRSQSLQRAIDGTKGGQSPAGGSVPIAPRSKHLEQQTAESIRNTPGLVNPTGK